MTIISPNSPAPGLLSMLATAYRNRRVAYVSVPRECRPPRIVIEFAAEGEVGAFERALRDLATADPAIPQLLQQVVGAISNLSLDTPRLTPDAWKWLLQMDVEKLLDVAEDHGPVKVLRVSPDYREYLVSIAAIALAALMRWDRDNAPGEAGDVVHPEPVPAARTVDTRTAACTDGLRPDVIRGPCTNTDEEIRHV
jgi:hypothetical protein